MTRHWQLFLVPALCGAVGVLACGDDGATTAGTMGGSSTGADTTGATPTSTSGSEPTTTEPMTSTSSTGSTGSTGTTDPTTSTGTTMGVTESTGTTAVACAPLTDCGGECVDIQTDNDHCGGCDQPCDDIDVTCIDGGCDIVPPCPGRTDCGGICVDTDNDPDNCGGCDLPCGPMEVCAMGQCALDCPMGQESCGGACVDTQADEAHCGGCDMPCGMCQTCVDSMCEDPGLLPPAEPIVGPMGPCAGAETMYSIPIVPGAMNYSWSVPVGASVTVGQGSPAVTVKYGAMGGQVCVTYSDGCADSQPTCLDITLQGGAPGQQVFMPTGGIQNFVVPVCVSSMTITAFGAQGGSDDGGRGAKMSGAFTVTPGETLGVVVGERGVANNCGSFPGTAGGGGGSFVWHLADNVEPMIAAGGGGGGNTNWGDLNCRKGLDGVIVANGTNGNGPMSALGGVGGNGGAGNAPSGTGSGGAGWKTAGQNSTWLGDGNGCTGGQPAFTFTAGAGSIQFGPGGEGGFGGGGGAVCGAGGGGGYSGGGAGEGSSCRAGGGGGGSFNTGANQDNLPGARLGAGEVTITWP